VITLHAVVAPLSLALSRRARVAEARIVARATAAASASRAGAPAELADGAWPRDADGVPAPVRGWHASFTDTAGLVAAAVAPCAVALDAEWLGRPRWEAARERFLESGELALFGDDGRETVLALWTAKEAVLKLARVGLADLARCPLVACDGERFVLSHRGVERSALVRRHGEHVVAVVCAEPFELALAALEAVTVP